MKIIVMSSILFLAGCAHYEMQDGRDMVSFGQATIKIEEPLCPTPLPEDPSKCPIVRVTVETRGFSDNFITGFSGLVNAAATVFGGGPPPNVIVQMPEERTNAE